MAKQGKQGTTESKEPVRRVRRSRGKVKLRSGLGKAWDHMIACTLRENRSHFLQAEARARREAKNLPPPSGTQDQAA